MVSVNNNAGAFYGENTLRGWQTRSKGNTGVGRVNGDGNVIASRLNYLYDPDHFDLLIRVPK
ncbi:hypothetical protein [Neomoorella thermoacetica]|uniref:hypothetical protein n=1 Tax=Neomoorella thermoacetica TaxID=1525 RepID=UPI00091A1E8C|nr:hypothetical protein [Moorella thermoacetica]OIQ53813.1 hypothetical protein MORE_17910 [Moorella thermoacetica]